MKFRKYISSLLFLTTVSLYAVSPSDIAPYVYPANIASAPSEVTYLADGTSYVALEGGTKLVKHDIATGKEAGV